MNRLPLSASLEDVRRNVNRWNQRDNIGLVEIADLITSERIVWEAGNCVICADRIDSRASEIALMQVKKKPPDNQAVKSWNGIGELCRQAGWATEFEPIKGVSEWFASDIVARSLAELPLEEAEQHGLKEDVEQARQILRLNELPTRQAAKLHLASLGEDTVEVKDADGARRAVPAQKEIEVGASREPSADVVILTILPEEYKAVYNTLSDPQPPSLSVPDTNLYAWVVAKVPHKQSGRSYSIALGMMGRPGSDPSALATTEAIAVWKPRYVFFVGIAGGFDQGDLQKGDVVIADLIYGYEYGKLEKKFLPRNNWVYRTDLALVNGATAFYTVHPDWTSSIKVDHPEKRASKAIKGQIASGDKVVDDPTNDSTFAP